MSWLHSQQSNFVFTVPVLMESTVCVCLVWALFAMHLFFSMPLLCQSLCVICRQLEVCGNRDLLLFSHMPLSTHPSSFLLSRHLCLFVCLHVKAVALVSLTHTHTPLHLTMYLNTHLSFSRPLTQGDVHWAVTESKDKHHINNTYHKLDYHSWYEFSRGFTLTTAGNSEWLHWYSRKYNRQSCCILLRMVILTQFG